LREEGEGIGEWEEGFSPSFPSSRFYSSPSPPPTPEMLDAQVITEVYLQGTKTRQVEYFFVVPFLVKINTTDMQLKHFSITIGKELSLQIVIVLFSANYCFEIFKKSSSMPRPF